VAMTINRAVLYDQLHYPERHIAAGASAIDKQRYAISRVEARDEEIEPARALLAQIKRAGAAHRRSDSICELLAT